MSGESQPHEDPIPIVRAESAHGHASTVKVELGLAIGEAVTGFPSLVGIDGETYTPRFFFERKGVLVLAFLGDACPAAKACVESLVSLQRRRLPEGVHIIGLNSNNPYLSPRDTVAEMARWALEQNINFPYLKDSDGELARRLGVTNTPHFLVLDRERRLRYRGRMFDSRDPARATTHDLEDAVDRVLAGLPIALPETHPLGCSLVW